MKKDNKNERALLQAGLCTSQIDMLSPNPQYLR